MQERTDLLCVEGIRNDDLHPFRNAELEISVGQSREMSIHILSLE